MWRLTTSPTAMPWPLLLACVMTALCSLPYHSAGESTAGKPPVFQRAHMDMTSVLRSLRALSLRATSTAAPANARTAAPTSQRGSGSVSGGRRPQPSTAANTRSDSSSPPHSNSTHGRLSGPAASIGVPSPGNTSGSVPRNTDGSVPPNTGESVPSSASGSNLPGSSDASTMDSGVTGVDTHSADHRPANTTAQPIPGGHHDTHGGDGDTHSAGHRPANTTAQPIPGGHHDTHGGDGDTHSTDHGQTNAPTQPSPGHRGSHGSHGDHSDHDHDGDDHRHILVVDPLAGWDDDQPAPPILDQHGHVFDQGEIDNAVRASLARWLTRRRTFSVMCVINDQCVLSTPSKPERMAAIARQGWMDNHTLDDDPCEGHPMTSQCCQTAVRDIEFVRNFIRMLKGRSDKLSTACEFLCVNSTQCYLTCDFTTFHEACEGRQTSTDSKQDENDQQDDQDENSSSAPPSADSLADQAGPDITVVIVSCLVAFLAGIGGAALIACLWRRRKASRVGSDNTAHSIDSSTFGADNANDEYEELPGTVPEGKPHTKTKVKRVSSENEYTYISDYAHTRRATPAAYDTPTRLHQANRKLPTAPRPEEDEQLSKENALPPERDTAKHSATSGDARPAYSLSKPIVGQQYFELEHESETPSDQPEASQRRLEKDREARAAQGQPTPTRRHFEGERPQKAHTSPGQPHAASGDQRCDVTALATHPASAAGSLPHHHHPRKATGGTASQHKAKGDQYAALCRDCQLVDEEYTALGSDKTSGTTTPEYLELVPDYFLQKPVH